MLFRFDITLTEEDYLNYNYFHSLESSHCKKNIQRTRMIMTLLLCLLGATPLLLEGVAVYSITFAFLMGVVALFYFLLFKKMVKNTIKAQLQLQKKAGKPPYEPIIRMEFWEDHMVSMTPLQRIDEKYEMLERICVVGNAYIYLYHNSISAYIIPIAQLSAQQISPQEFLRYLNQKCSTLERY